MPMASPELVDITCFVRMETPRAYLINDGTKEVWVPKSQCELERGDKMDTVTLPVWLARDKGLV